MKLAGSILMGLLGLLLGCAALCTLLGLGTLRQAPPSAVALAGVALLTLPTAGIASLIKPRWVGALSGAVLWPLALLVGVPIFFPGERTEALSTGLATLSAPFGARASQRAAGIGEVIGSWMGPELLAGQPPTPHAAPQAAPPQPVLAVTQIATPRAVEHDPESLALPYEGQGRSLRVPVGLEQDGFEVERWMLFDTGATYTTLTTQALADLGVRIPSDAPQATLHTANGVTTAPLVLLDRVWLGGFAVENVTVAVCDLCGSDTSAGLLGLNVSGQFTVTFDPGAQMLELTPQAGNRELDLSHWVHLRGTATGYPDGRIEVETEADNLSDHDIARLDVEIECASERFTATLTDIEPGGTGHTRVRLPRGTECDPYVLRLQSGSW
ncbi:MAG: retropepsin-like aspartic protease [Myxococcota bacterium]|nr:retropepsin-like aspartic protease [Myxococcota bacterium]